jgi:hygromycin-B 7''-O-kinase
MKAEMFFFKSASDYFENGETIFIHMVLHPWNLLVDKINGLYKICGVLDFADPVITRSHL